MPLKCSNLIQKTTATIWPSAKEHASNGDLNHAIQVSNSEDSEYEPEDSQGILLTAMQLCHKSAPKLPASVQSATEFETFRTVSDVKRSGGSLVQVEEGSHIVPGRKEGHTLEVEIT